MPKNSTLLLFVSHSLVNSPPPDTCLSRLDSPSCDARPEGKQGPTRALLSTKADNQETHKNIFSSDAHAEKCAMFCMLHAGSRHLGWLISAFFRQHPSAVPQTYALAGPLPLFLAGQLVAFVHALEPLRGPCPWSFPTILSRGRLLRVLDAGCRCSAAGPPTRNWRCRESSGPLLRTTDGRLRPSDRQRREEGRLPRRDAAMPSRERPRASERAPGARHERPRRPQQPRGWGGACGCENAPTEGSEGAQELRHLFRCCAFVKFARGLEKIDRMTDGSPKKRTILWLGAS